VQQQQRDLPQPLLSTKLLRRRKSKEQETTTTTKKATRQGYVDEDIGVVGATVHVVAAVAMKSK
jgi:hypothetical protein